MYRAAIVAALLIIGCSKAKDDTTPAGGGAMAAPATLSLADLAGTWEAKAMPVGKDTVVTTFEMTGTGTADGWSMKLSNGQTPALKVTVGGDSLITEAGPFASVLRAGQQVTTHTVSRLQSGKLVGVIHAKYSNGDTATLRMEATKKP